MFFSFRYDHSSSDPKRNVKRESAINREMKIEALKCRQGKYTAKKTRGWLDVSGSRMCLLDISGGWVNIVLSMILFAGEDTARRVLFEAGHSESFSGTAIQKGILDPTVNGLNEALNIFSESGFGDFLIRDLAFSKGYVRITCRDTFEAWAFLRNKHHSETAVCHYTTGVLLSFMEHFSAKRDLISVENKCIAKGDDECEFLIGTETILKKMGIAPPEWGMTIKEKAEYLENLLNEKKRMQEGLTRKNIQLSALNKISGAIIHTRDMMEILNLVIRELSAMVGDKQVGIYLLDRNREELVFTAQKGFSKEFYKSVSRLKMGEGVSGKVVRQKSVAVYDNYAECPNAIETALKKEKIKSILSVPLMNKDRIVGVLNVATQTPYHFSRDEINLMTLIGNQIAVAVETARLHEDIRKSERKVMESRRMAAIGELSANIAHEIRNPLSAIKTNIQILSRNLNLQGFDKRRLEIASGEILRLDRILEDTLDFATPVKLNRVDHDVREVIDKCILLLGDKIEEAGIRMVKKMAGSLPSLAMDYEKMQQAILNLIINAIDAMPGGGTLEVITGFSMRLGQKAIRVEIKDSGYGIPPLNMEKIFDPFFSTKTKGAGLGLPSVKKIIEAHHGRIQVISRPRKGVRIRLLFPMEYSMP